MILIVDIDRDAKRPPPIRCIVVNCKLCLDIAVHQGEHLFSILSASREIRYFLREKKLFLKINLFAKGLTEGVSGDRG